MTLLKLAIFLVLSALGLTVFAAGLLVRTLRHLETHERKDKFWRDEV